ncbi:unnamed protein product [Closterium sp. NIES-53]
MPGPAMPAPSMPPPPIPPPPVPPPVPLPPVPPPLMSPLPMLRRPNGKVYVVLIGHRVTDKWELHQVMLAFRNMTGGHGAEDIVKVTAIPQDPVLFGSSLWFNIDPFNQHLDAALWEALGAVQLKGKVGALQSGLEASMSEFGENFSVGQLQLLCLARWVGGLLCCCALLRAA